MNTTLRLTDSDVNTKSSTCSQTGRGRRLRSRPDWQGQKRSFPPGLVLVDSRGTEEVLPSNNSIPRVIIKGLYSRMNCREGRAEVRQYVRHLERSSANTTRRRHSFFNNSSVGISSDAAIERIKRWSCDRNYYRLIVAVDGADDLDFKRLAREFIQCLEVLLQTSAEYFAIVHDGSKLPHIHFIVRGVTERGKPLRTPEWLMCYGMREIAEELVLEQICKGDQVARTYHSNPSEYKHVGLPH